MWFEYFRSVLAPTICMGMCFMGAFLYRQGLRDGASMEKGEPLSELSILPKRKKPEPEPAGPDRYDVLLGNIDRFDGTSLGQEEVPDK